MYFFRYFYCRRVTLILSAVILCLVTIPLYAEEFDKTPGFSSFPLQEIYPRYIADPYRVTMSAKPQFYRRSDIPQAGDKRLDLRTGAPLPLMQYNWPGIQSQLVLEGMIRGQFDTDNSKDNIGWEGLYAFYATFRLNDRFALRTGYRHFSSHVGDEYIERTGRKRINYTREEFRVGVNYGWLDDLQIYVDSGYAINLRNKEKQRRWRHQLGAQYERPGTISDAGMGWYAALDVSAYQENDYDLNTTFQLGLLVPRDERQWRFYLETYTGRSHIGEFFENSESYFGFGLSIDV